MAAFIGFKVVGKGTCTEAACTVAVQIISKETVSLPEENGRKMVMNHTG